MINFIFTTAVFLIALGILVVLHEWGHYIVAKLVGIWVEKFSIGFGPKILGFQKNGTDYRIAPIPLGGYVKLYGQDPYEEADRDEVKAKEIAKDPRSFASKTYWQRMCVVLAGPVMNFILCLVLLPISFMVGKKELRIEQAAPIVIGIEEGSVAEQMGLQLGDLIVEYNETPVKDWTELMFKSTNHGGKKAKIKVKRAEQVFEKDFVVGTKDFSGKVVGFLGIEPHPFIIDKPIIGQVNADSQAALAGLTVGDEILSVNAKPVGRWSKMVELIQAEAAAQAGQLKLEIMRDGKVMTIDAVAKYDSTDKRWLLGMLQKFPDDLYTVRSYPLGMAVQLGLQEFHDLSFKLYDFLGGLFGGEISVKNLGGPLEIASATSSAAKRGIGDFVYLLAFLSLQLGIVNLLPIPVLDGGHALIMTLELIIRRSLPHKLRLVTLYSGAIFIMSLMGFVVFNDLNRYLGLSKIWGSVVSWFGS